MNFDSDRESPVILSPAANIFSVATPALRADQKRSPDEFLSANLSRSFVKKASLGRSRHRNLGKAFSNPHLSTSEMNHFVE